MLELLKDLWGFMKARKKFWLAPILLVLATIGLSYRIDSGLSGGTVYLYVVLAIITPLGAISGLRACTAALNPST